MKLPEDFNIKFSKEVSFVVKGGSLQPSKPARYPDMSGSANELKKFNLHQEYLFSSFLGQKETIPVQLTEKGVVTDPLWWGFGCFYGANDQSKRDKRNIIIHLIATHQLDWKTSCPTLSEHCSYIGHIMKYYNDEHGQSDVHQLMIDFPISFLLKDANKQDLQEFRDQGFSLLDLALENHLWQTAEWLWEKGVRFSGKAHNQAAPLKHLATGSLQAQDIYDFPKDALREDQKLNPQQRVQWIATWLSRWETYAPQETQSASFLEHVPKRELLDQPKFYDWDSVVSTWAKNIQPQLGPVETHGVSLSSKREIAVLEETEQQRPWVLDIVKLWVELFNRKGIRASHIQINDFTAQCTYSIAESSNDGAKMVAWIDRQIIEYETQSTLTHPSSSRLRL